MESTLPQQSYKFMSWQVGDGYLITKEIGKGGYGVVVEAIQKSTLRKVAIKRMQQVFSSQNILYAKRILRELILLKRLRHQYIIELIDIIEPEDRQQFDEIYLVLELADKDLRHVIKSEDVCLSIDEVRTLAYKVLCCLNYLHSAKIIHRDLKPQNILVTNMQNDLTKEKNPVEEWKIKVCDFGLARSLVGVESDQIITETFGRQFSIHYGNEQEKVQEEASDDKSQEQDEIELIVTEGQNARTLPTIELISQPELKEEIKSEFDESSINDTLQKMNYIQPQINKLSRELSNYVVTRYYRPPEVILMSKEYGSPVDVWSYGCIFAEILKMMDKDASTRSCLFEGQHCFTLSPNKHLPNNVGNFTIHSQDQIYKIIEILGFPNDRDQSFISEKKHKDYLNAYSPYSPSHKQDLKNIFTQASPEAISLLEHTLVFNPYFRYSVDKALHHDFFKPIHSCSMEVSTQEIDLEFDHITEPELTLEELRNIFLREIDEIKQQKH